MKLNLMERVIYACISVSMGVTNLSAYGPASKRIDCFDHDVLIWNGQVTLGIVNLMDLLEPVFITDLKPWDKRHVLFDRQFPNKLAKYILDDHEIERKEYNCSLLHLALQAIVR